MYDPGTNNVLVVGGMIQDAVTFVRLLSKELSYRTHWSTKSLDDRKKYRGYTFCMKEHSIVAFSA
jgi:hypothetical protein